MRVVTVSGVLLAVGAATLNAQHRFQFEIGGFGAYTRFDRAFQIANQFGGGGRLGFWLTDWLEIEGDGVYQRPHPKAGGADFPVWFGSGSVVLNFGAEKSYYILGGYSAMDFNSSAVGGFRDTGVHGAIGNRFSISDRAALRLEARAYYAHKTQLPGGTWGGQLVGTAGLSFFLGGKPKEGAPAGGPVVAEAGPGLQFEIGGFGAYTRFDRAFQIANQFGGGGRLGLWLTDWLEIEGDGLYQRPHPKAGGADFPVWFGSGSLVLNFGAEKSYYILGGYSAMDFNSSAVGGFRDTGMHGAIGDRIYISDRTALRLEARAYYAPKTQLPGGTWGGQLVGTAGLSFFIRPSRHNVTQELPKAKRDSILAAGGKLPQERPRGGPAYEQRSADWQHKWYWGAQGGLFVFRTNFDSYAFEPTFGGHWLITGKKTALYVAYEQSFFLSERHTTIIEPGGAVNPGNVSFKDARRIMVGVLAFPAQLRVEPFAGGGFAIVELLNTQATCVSCTNIAQVAQLQDEADNAASKAFFWWMGGVDIKQGRLALYGHYILMSSASTFLIAGVTHTFQGGVRYSLGNAREGVTDR